MQESIDQWKLVKESKEYFTKKLTKEDIYFIVSEITQSCWVKTDEKSRLMFFKVMSDKSEFSVGLWNETIFDLLAELNASNYNEAFMAGQTEKINEMKKVLELK